MPYSGVSPKCPSTFVGLGIILITADWWCRIFIVIGTPLCTPSFRVIVAVPMNTEDGESRLLLMGLLNSLKFDILCLCVSVPSSFVIMNDMYFCLIIVDHAV
jgi:hypothetical protein